MAGVLIYKSGLQYYSRIASDDGAYRVIKRDLFNLRAQILWKKENVILEKIEKARKTKDNLLARLNEGEKVSFNELDLFFK